MGSLTHTVSGDIASFRSAARVPIESLKCHFLPIQEGTGDPSPDNVRPIKGWDGITAYKAKKNIGHIVAYSAGTLNSPTSTPYIQGNYGNSISQSEPLRSVIFTQTEWHDDISIYNYRNGYWCIQVDNLRFGQRYDLSFKITNITNNPLNASLSNIRIANPYGNYFSPTILNDNTILFKNFLFTQNNYRPLESDIPIYMCGLTCTLSEFMITPTGMNDGVWEPYCGDIIPITFPTTGKNKLPVNSATVQRFKEIKLTVPLPIGTYTVSALVTSNDTDKTTSAIMFANGRIGDKNLYVQLDRNIRTAKTFTLQQPVSIIYIYAAAEYDSSANDEATWTNIQLELGETETSYEPYNSNNTVYGGYVDIAKGEIVATHILLENSWSEWTLHGTQTNTVRKYLIPPYEIYSSSSYNNVSRISNIARYSYAWTELDETHFYVSSSTRIYMWLPINTDESTKVQVIGALLNPIHYSLSKIELKTFLDQNNIWSNTNDITEVTYAIHDAAPMRAAKERIVAASPHIENVASGNTNDSTQIAHFITDLAAPFKSCRIDFKPLQWGNDTPTPDNVRAIKGWNSIPIHVAGRNLLEHDLSGSGTFVRSSFTNNSDGSITLTRNSTGGAHIAINNISDSSRALAQQNWMKKVLPAGEYKNHMMTSDGSLVQADALGYLLQPQIAYDNAYSPEHASATNNAMTNPATGNNYFTIDENFSYSWFRIYSGANYPAGTVTLYPAVFLKSESDRSYEKFNGYTLEITLPETIYGGYIDLIKGELVATMGKYTIDENTPFYTSTSNPTSWIRIDFNQITGLPAIKSRNQDGINRGEMCDKIEIIHSVNDRTHTSPTVLIGTYKNNQFYNSIYIYDMDTYNTSLATSTDLENYLRELAPTFIYPIEPITFSLTPQTLNTLRGVNNVWSDAGTVSLSYWTH